ncbi:MAG: A/G-specific adenine glycosylase [Actinomycetota bacterium]
MSRQALLAWFEPRRRAYPWRGARDPYRVLVSEMMLQQTQAARVAPAYRSFLRRFPTIRALARASPADVVRAWGSLGYNRRAMALSEAARVIVRDHGGRVPGDPRLLAGLPGVGPYTAAAVASLGHGVPVPAIDTNVRRVVARARIGRDDAAPAEVEEATRAWLDLSDPGSWNQALMDLGREVCRLVPRCEACPLSSACRFRREGSTPARRRRRQARFEGSVRQVRGGVIRELRGVGSMTLAALAARLGRGPADVRSAVQRLSAEGLVRADPAAVAGRASGRVRLAP